MTKRRAMLWLSVATIVLWLGIRWANSRSRPPHTLGTTDGQLADCPNRPNCVSTQSASPDRRLPPIPLDERTADEALKRLEETIRSIPRSRIVRSGNGYLHAEFRSQILGFVDDVEFTIDEPNQLIHFRSAARVGYSDRGVNRKRMEEIRRRYRAL